MVSNIHQPDGVHLVANSMGNDDAHDDCMDCLYWKLLILVI